MTMAGVGRVLCWLTVLMIAGVTTAGALGLWYVTHGPQPMWRVEVAHPHLILAGYVLLMVSPWWALLAVMFSRMNGWIQPTSQRRKNTPQAAPGVSRVPLNI